MKTVGRHSKRSVNNSPPLPRVPVAVACVEKKNPSVGCCGWCFCPTLCVGLSTSRCHGRVFPARGWEEGNRDKNRTIPALGGLPQDDPLRCAPAPARLKPKQVTLTTLQTLLGSYGPYYFVGRACPEGGGKFPPGGGGGGVSVVSFVGAGGAFFPPC